MKKKICLLKYDFNNIGGTEMVTAKLANEFVEDYEVHVISVATETGNIERFNFDSRVHYKNFYSKKERIRKIFLPAVKQIRNYLKEHEIDLVFSIGVQSHAFLILGSRGTKAKTVACDHMTVKNDYGNKSYALQRWLGAKYADKVVVLTEENLNGYLAKYRFKQERLAYIYNWIDEVNVEKPYDKGSKQIVTVGRLAEAKGYDYLMTVAQDVLKKHPDWTWHICGDGDSSLKTTLTQFIEDNHFENRLVLRGNVQDMSAVYQKSAIYVMTSRYEGLPLVLLEAKQHHLPIVSFNCPTGPSEIIRNEENGYLIDDFNTLEMAEKINQLIDCQEEREHFSQNSYLDIDKFSKPVILKQWRDLIKELTHD